MIPDLCRCRPGAGRVCDTCLRSRQRAASACSCDGAAPLCAACRARRADIITERLAQLDRKDQP